MDRRAFLKALGLGAAATAAGLALPEPEPIRRYWAVPRSAPVGRSYADYERTLRLNADEFVSANPGWVRPLDAESRPWPQKYEHVYKHALVVQKGGGMIRPVTPADLQPIGVVENIDHKTGLATVRLTVDSLPVWRGFGTA